MGKWKAVRKEKQDDLLRVIIKRMVAEDPTAEAYEVPLGLIGMFHRESGGPAAVVTFLMDSPEVAEQMNSIRLYRMERGDVEKIITIGAGAAITWLRPRAMDLLARAVLEGEISMPDFLALVAYETVMPPFDLREGKAEKEFSSTLGGIALTGGFVSHNSIDE